MEDFISGAIYLLFIFGLFMGAIWLLFKIKNIIYGIFKIPEGYFKNIYKKINNKLLTSVRSSKILGNLVLLIDGILIGVVIPVLLVYWVQKSISVFEWLLLIIPAMNILLFVQFTNGGYPWLIAIISSNLYAFLILYFGMGNELSESGICWFIPVILIDGFLTFLFLIFLKGIKQDFGLMNDVTKED